jgi:hypothetical protein
MIEFILILVAFALGCFLGPKLKAWFITFKSDPMSAINAEIAALHALKDKVMNAPAGTSAKIAAAQTPPPQNPTAGPTL